MDKPSHWVTFLNDNFNPIVGFVHILPKIGFKTTQHFLVWLNALNDISLIEVLCLHEVKFNHKFAVFTLWTFILAVDDILLIFPFN